RGTVAGPGRWGHRMDAWGHVGLLHLLTTGCGAQEARLSRPGGSANWGTAEIAGGAGLPSRVRAVSMRPTSSFLPFGDVQPGAVGGGKCRFVLRPRRRLQEQREIFR